MTRRRKFIIPLLPPASLQTTPKLASTPKASGQYKAQLERGTALDKKVKNVKETDSASSGTSSRRVLRRESQPETLVNKGNTNEVRRETTPLGIRTSANVEE
jgi:hypothetical protein